VRLRVVPPSRASHLFIKIPRPGDGLDEEYTRTRDLYQVLADSSPRFSCVEPLAYYHSPEALVVSECTGCSLQEMIDASCRWLAVRPMRDTLLAVEAAGAWLAHLERVSVGAQPADEVWQVLREDTACAVANLRRAGSFERDALLIERCVRDIEDAAGRGDAKPIYLAHGDFHAGNLFIAPGDPMPVSVIDCRLSRPRFVGFDALLLEHHLRMSFRQYRPWAIRSVLRSFQNGYGRRLHPRSGAVKSTRALFVLNSLVYVATLAAGGSIRAHLGAAVDRRRLAGMMVRRLLTP